jgi:hypothetical protein
MAAQLFIFPHQQHTAVRPANRQIGPTAVALKQLGPWTDGFLINQIWSFAGDNERNDVNLAFMQPFAGYTTADAWSFDVQMESTYNWESEQWNFPLVFLVSKVTSIGSQLVQVQPGTRNYIDSFDERPEGWGFRLAVTLLLPR